MLEIPKLQLTQRQYCIGPWGGEVQGHGDYLLGVMKFNVVDDDYFGTGRMVSEHLNGKAVLIDHNWSFPK